MKLTYIKKGSLKTTLKDIFKLLKKIYSFQAFQKHMFTST